MAWNVMRGSDLETHTDALTKEQADQINAENDIVLAVGDHGLSKEYARDHSEMPTQLEYNRIASFVRTLKPGDALFLEYVGFPRQRKPLPEQAERTEANSLGVFKRLMGWLALSGSPLDHEKYPDLEEARQNNEVDLFSYAARYAERRGIPVIYADIDEYVENMFTRGGDVYDLVRSNEAVDVELSDHMNRVRERTARNTIKDWALAHPVKGEEGGRKRRLVLLFGYSHAEGLERTFDELGLEIRTHELPMPLPFERAAEQQRHSGPLNDYK